MRMIVLSALLFAAGQAHSEQLKTYPQCIKALNDALTITGAMQSLSLSAMQSVKGPSIPDAKGGEINLVEVNSSVTAASANLVRALAAICEEMR